jgi:hypothetical protein
MTESRVRELTTHHEVRDGVVELVAGTAEACNGRAGAGAPQPCGGRTNRGIEGGEQACLKGAGFARIAGPLTPDC